MIDFQYFFHFLTSFLHPSPLRGEGRVRGRGRRGQTAIEYLLMLAIVAALITILGMLFNRRLLGGFFSMVGMIIGDGLGKT